MQKWEYIEVTAPMRDDGKSVRIYLNGEETLPESRVSVLYDFLNKLGKEGWEMINFAFYPNRTAFYYFKRLVE
ncbi:MAG TPA: hypothetical protein VHP14_27565 [Anaerolineales bacterium]|jgi:hypothetical protein|nr:hypothetical protein [Anaerolineales bacterium]